MNDQGIARWSITIKLWQNDGTLAEDTARAVTVDGVWTEAADKGNDPLADIALDVVAAVRMLEASKALIRPLHRQTVGEMFSEIGDFEQS
jgi:hypothetical protein